MTCNITDISPLASLTELTYFRIMNNSVEDISILQNLLEIEELNLKHNEISDIAPLVNNPGLDEGDILDIRFNDMDLTEGSEDMQNIEELQSRGVIVYY
jgi:Leucine-rich repeat (LRR) protein